MGLILDSPAEIIRQLLVDLELGSGSPPGPWPVFATTEPDAPDDVITVADTTPLLQGRVHVTGEQPDNPGFQVRVRSGTHNPGYVKAAEIADALSRRATRAVVTVGDRTYLIQSVTRTTGVIPLGRESPASRRRLFTLNAVMSLYDL